MESGRGHRPARSHGSQGPTTPCPPGLGRCVTAAAGDGEIALGAGERLRLHSRTPSADGWRSAPPPHGCQSPPAPAPGRMGPSARAAAPPHGPGLRSVSRAVPSAVPNSRASVLSHTAPADPGPPSPLPPPQLPPVITQPSERQPPPAGHARGDSHAHPTRVSSEPEPSPLQGARPRGGHAQLCQGAGPLSSSCSGACCRGAQTSTSLAAAS